MNRYLQDRAYKRNMRDGRNPYGSRVGYVSSRKGRVRDRESMDRNYDYRDYDMKNRNMDYHHQPMSNYHLQQMPYGIPMYRDYEMTDYARYDYESEDMEKEYEKELHTWIEKLKKKDRFGLSKEMVIQKAREMGVNFDEFDELEFYAVYLMIVSDHKKSILDPNLAILQAQEFFEDDDIAVSPSEKVCIYLYEIVLGKD